MSSTVIFNLFRLVSWELQIKFYSNITVIYYHINMLSNNDKYGRIKSLWNGMYSKKYCRRFSRN